MSRKPTVDPPDAEAQQAAPAEIDAARPLDFLQLNKFGAALSGDEVSKLEAYASELLKFNKKLNLISPLSTKRVEYVHFLDAILSWRIVSKGVPRESTVFDFGSGNGIPGLVWAVLAPDVRFRIVDRDTRKLEFCKHVGASLGLKNVAYSRMDVKDLPEGSVEFATSRGFAAVTKSLLLSRHLFKKGGHFFMLKGEGWTKEVAEVPTQLFGVWDVRMLGQYRLPDSPADFVVLDALRKD